MKCVICNQPSNKCINMSYSNVGPDGERHHWAGKLYVCGEHRELVTTMPIPELELFVRANAPPAPSPLAIKEREEIWAEKPIEPQMDLPRNGNGVT